ncbi:hypothetical protein C3L33_14497, partial [Rhododendron williamsianum]
MKGALCFFFVLGMYMFILCLYACRMVVSMLYIQPQQYTLMQNTLNINLGHLRRMTTSREYADRKNAYWTGYFTSRPGLKGYVRVMSGYYLAARQLEFFRGRSEKGPTTDSLGDALAIAQHHDAVSGTSKQHVADDYAKRLFIGYKEAEELVAASLACMVDSGLKSGCRNSVTKFQQAKQ